MLVSSVPVHSADCCFPLQFHFVYRGALCLNKGRIWGTCEVNPIYANTHKYPSIMNPIID